MLWSRTIVAWLDHLILETFFFFFFFLMKLAQNIRIINIIILTSINAVVEKYSFLTVGEICYKTREIFNPETIPIIPEKCASPAF